MSYTIFSLHICFRLYIPHSGEWCSTKHSIKYNQLPGYFIAFDLYDRLEEKFYSRKRLHELLYGSAIPCAPVICSKKFGPYPSTKSNGMKKASAFQADVRELLETKSRFATNGGFVEGLSPQFNEIFFSDMILCTN